MLCADNRKGFAAAAVLLSFAIFGVTAAVAAKEERVVSVGGSVTEIVYALGEADRLAAVDTTSQYPPAARELPNVGYLRQLSAEPILALSPTMILAEPDAGPPSALEQIRDAGARLVTVPDRPSPTGALEKISAVADALDVPEKGEALRSRVAGEFEAVEAALDGVEAAPRVLFLLSMRGGAPLAAGDETAADAIIRLAAGRNAVTGYADYKPLTPEAAVDLAPDVILINAAGGHSPEGGLDAFLARPEIAATPAGREGRIVAMDGLLLLGFGPRTPQAIRKLAAALHPQIELARTGEK